MQLHMHILAVGAQVTHLRGFDGVKGAAQQLPAGGQEAPGAPMLDGMLAYLLDGGPHLQAMTNQVCISTCRLTVL